MTSDDYTDADIDDNNKYYGFRYPDKIKSVNKLPEEYRTKILTGWRRLVTWMAHHNL